MSKRTRGQTSDPVLEDQAGRQTPIDPGDPVQAASEENIRLRAYELYEQRGARGGEPDQDWFHAEAELLNHRQS